MFKELFEEHWQVPYRKAVAIYNGGKEKDVTENEILNLRDYEKDSSKYPNRKEYIKLLQILNKIKGK